MKRIIPAILFFFSILNVSVAQVAILKSTAFVDSVSQPGLKKYGIKLSFDGINVPIMYETIGNVNGVMKVFYGDSIPDIFNSNNTNQEMNNFLFLVSSAKNMNNTAEFVLDITSSPFSQNIMSFPLVSTSTGLNCDGKIHTSMDTSDNTLSNFHSTVQAPGASATLSLGQNSLDTLCSGKYRITESYKRAMYADSLVFISSSTGFLIGQYVFPSATSLNIDVNTYQEATSPACDGKARVSILNSTIPFLCAFDGGNYTSSDSIINLCEGIHSVLVATANDTVGKYFVVANDSSIINNQNPYGPVVDTIIYNYTNCHFNYNLPIDSAFLLYANIIDSNTIYLSWEIWQQGSSVNVSDTMSWLYQTGNNMISLNIFCGSARTTNANNFKTFRINDFAYLSNTITSVQKNIFGSFHVYPNPFSGNLMINSKDISTIKSIEITNLLGEIMDTGYQINDQEVKILTENLVPGFYMVSVTEKSGKMASYKVIKQ